MSKIPLLLTVAALCAWASPSSAQQPHATAPPPISFSCPMDPDVITDRAGTCPRCGMELVPVRLDTAYACPLHPSVIETRPGACRICRRQLVAVTVSLFWTCAGHPEVHELKPGACADGQPRTAARERRAHGDHNPRHGGQFFMAPDNWHHLEGTYPRAGVFRVFLYDDFTRPVGLRGMAARAVAHRSADFAVTSGADEASVSLKPSADGRYLEAYVPLTLPARITATIRFKPGGPDQHFDFDFPAYTREPTPGAAPVAAPAAAARLEPAAPNASTRTSAALIAELRSGKEQVEALLQQGSLAQLYIPALATKDAALALDAHASELPKDRRAAATAAVKRIVLAAWSIDRYGDLGDRQRLDAAFRSFSDAVVELMKAYEGVR
ncbi:MAG TPA: heavy metal-binding domain-containing protein [Vicinamibacterales bacterium]|nr:heavy metal-binding domain-containing protein [Vicinamibacterales bacterium]